MEKIIIINGKETEKIENCDIVMFADVNGKACLVPVDQVKKVIDQMDESDRVQYLEKELLRINELLEKQCTSVEYAKKKFDREREIRLKTEKENLSLHNQIDFIMNFVDKDQIVSYGKRAFTMLLERLGLYDDPTQSGN